MINVMWSNDLERLAELMAGNLAEEKAESPDSVFARKHCVVVPNRILQHWFQHNYLYDQEADGLKILANIDYPLLHQFVNDWLYKMNHTDKKRDPSEHPFAAANMQWRIYDALTSELMTETDYKPLNDYIEAAGKKGAAKEQRCFGLAGQLSRLFDDYQVYRPIMMKDWMQGKNTDADKNDMLWQPALWRHITNDLKEETYLNAFWEMENQLGNCKITESHPAVHVFGISMMPRVYARFFDILSEKCGIKVNLYLFNPCNAEWDSILSQHEILAETERARMEGIPEEALLLEINNPLISNMGRGCRDFLGEILDMTAGQVPDVFKAPKGDKILKKIQQDIYANVMPENEFQVAEDDDSLQLHICHSPMREVEVLKDQLLSWFTEDENLQPRHVQVLVSDMTLYAPYIDAVFSTFKKNAKSTIPYSIADRVSVGESVIGEAFNRLLNLSDSRFSAPEVIELLQCESVYRAFGLSENDLETVQALVTASGIRWGRDKKHRTDELNVDFTECTTWQHGLDRLMLGFVLTRDSAMDNEGLPLVCDKVEGGEAEVLGRFIRFFDCLKEASDTVSKKMTPEEWSNELTKLVETFFAKTNDTYRDISSLLALAETIRTSCSAGEFSEKIPVAVVRDFIAGQMDNVAGGESLTGNSVVFGSLRAGATAPRRIICLLGLGDRQFPRSDNRTAYDLFRQKRHRGDPSVRTEDRMAFLEALISAKDRLYISYVGRTIKEDETIPPSTVISELMEYVDTLAGNEALKPVIHKLQPFNKIYFGEDETYFSYDKSNCRAAQGIANPTKKAEDKTGKSDPTETLVPKMEIELDQLIRFFKNPAESYHRALKIKIDTPDSEQLSENEEFSPYGLSAYKINTEIVTSLCEDAVPADTNNKKRDSLYKLLEEQGLPPLGESGKNWFSERWDDLEKLLDQEVRSDGKLGELLKKQEDLSEDPMTINIGDATITGKLTGWKNDVADESSVITVDYRCASEKAKDKMTSWIQHLFACAAGLNEQRYCIAAKTSEKKNFKLTFFPALTASEAKEHLSQLLTIFAYGLSAIPTFTPATSLAFANGIRKAFDKVDDPDKKDLLQLAEGRKKAKKAWYSDPKNNSYGDDDNGHFRLAFGVDGPLDMNEQQFTSLAKVVFYPMLDAVKRGK